MTEGMVKVELNCKAAGLRQACLPRPYTATGVTVIGLLGGRGK